LIAICPDFVSHTCKAIYDELRSAATLLFL